MDGVLQGFFVVGVVLLIGYILGRTKTLGPEGSKVLSTLTFMVGLPCLMFSAIASRHISDVLSATGLISVVTAVAVMVVFTVAGLIGRWGVRRTTIGALSVGIVNSTNLGVPLSLYILGSATYVTPIMLFQLAIVTPIALTILDLTDPAGKHVSIWRVLSIPFRNPVTVAAILGIVVSALGIELPRLVLDPLTLVAQLAVPLMLIIFGMSLHGLSVRPGIEDRVPTTIAVILEVGSPARARMDPGRLRLPPGPLQHIRGHGVCHPSNRPERGPLCRPLRRGPRDCPVNGGVHQYLGCPTAAGGGLAVRLRPTAVHLAGPPPPTLKPDGARDTVCRGVSGWF